MAKRKKKKLLKLEFEQLSKRERMGLTQKELAEFFGISLAQFAMAEIHQRSLPLKASELELFLLTSFYEAADGFQPDVSLQTISEDECKNIGKELEKLREEKTKLMRLLVEYRGRNKRTIFLLEVCKRLEPKLTDQHVSGLSSLGDWLKKCNREFSEYGRLPQARLQFRIDEIDRKIAFLEGFLN